MTHFPKYGLSGCGIDPLRGPLSVHPRSGLYPRLTPRPGGAIEAGTGRVEVREEVPLLLSRHRTSSETHPAGARELPIFKEFRCRLSTLTRRGFRRRFNSLTARPWVCTVPCMLNRDACPVKTPYRCRFFRRVVNVLLIERLFARRYFVEKASAASMRPS